VPPEPGLSPMEEEVNEMKEEELEELMATVYNIARKDVHGLVHLRKGDPGYEEADRLLGSHWLREFPGQEMTLRRWADYSDRKVAPGGWVSDRTKIAVNLD